MTLTTTGLALLAAIGLGVWFKKDSSFRRREVLAMSVFWILVFMTPWGAAGVGKAQEFLGTGVQTVGNTINSVSG